MESFDVLDRVRVRQADPLSTNVRGFDGCGYEVHGDETKATTIAPVTSPVALAMIAATERKR